MSGCGPTLALHPLYTDKELVADMPLEGKWGEAEDEEVWTISRSGTAYQAVSSGKSESEKVDIRIVRLGETRFLDIASTEVPSLAVAGHMFCKAWMDGEELRLQVMDSEWLRQKIRETGLPFLELEGDQMLLTAPTKELQKFVMLYAAEPKAFGSEVGKFRRVAPKR